MVYYIQQNKWRLHQWKNLSFECTYEAAFTDIVNEFTVTVTAEDFDQALEKVNDVLEEMYRNAPSAKDEIHLKDPELEELCIERF